MQRQNNTTADQILQAVTAHPGCTLDELAEHVNTLTWWEVFLEVDRLSRCGALCLTHSEVSFLTTIRVREGTGKVE